MSREPAWLFDCSCGNKLQLLHCGVVQSTEGCDFCNRAIAGEIDGFDPLSGVVAAELDWCLCGRPWHIDRLMLAYLGQDDRILSIDDEDDAGLLLAYLADHLGWTEHGGGIGGAWLTPEGEQALANLRQHLERRPDPDEVES